MIKQTSKASLRSARSNYSDNSDVTYNGERSVEAMIHDPIRCSYLFQYCVQNYCCENIKFAMVVDKFRDYFMTDLHAWDKTKYLEYDPIIYKAAGKIDIKKDFLKPLEDGTLIPEEAWPSKKVHRVVVLKMLKDIWHEFLSSTSPYEICIDTKFLNMTLAKVKYIHIYGRDVFSDAVLDPIKTLRRDIIPRFNTSANCRVLMDKLRELEEVPTADTLHLAPPQNTIHKKYTVTELRDGTIRFTLREIVEDRTLYNEFLKYLDSTVCSENLRCFRAIQIFSDIMDTVGRTNAQSGKNGDASTVTSAVATLNEQASQHAWLVYKYFLMRGASYEISVTTAVKRDVMRNLAEPTISIFDQVEKSVWDMLQHHYATYTQKSSYLVLADLVANRIERTSDFHSGRNGKSSGSSMRLELNESTKKVRTAAFCGFI